MKNLDKIIKESVAKVLKEEIGGDYDTLVQKFIALNQISRHFKEARKLIDEYGFDKYEFAHELNNAIYDISDADLEIKGSLIKMGMTREEYQKLRQM